jgi:AcrR family transcriptional regulator
MGHKVAVAQFAPNSRSLGPDKVSVRRNPLQGRSQTKVERILSATAVLADTVPLESITMAQIGEAAGASFSSIYRFFPSKEAIFEAVALASLTRLQARYEAYFTGPINENPAEIIDHAIDIYVQFVDEEPGFKALWIEGMQAPTFAGLAHSVPDKAISMARAYAVRTLGYPENPDLDLRLAIAETATSQVLRFAFQNNGYPQEKVIAEIKRWLKAALLMLA